MKRESKGVLEMTAYPSNYICLCSFNLYKENKDTQEALGVIGKMLGIQV